MRVSRDITGWSILVEVGRVRQAGLAIGLASTNPFTLSDEDGGSLFTRTFLHGFGSVRSLDELPFDAEAASGWCVTPTLVSDMLSIRAPDGTYLVHDLELSGPPGWSELAAASGSVMLVVSHVLPPVVDMAGQLNLEAEQGHVCAGPVRFGGFAPSRSGGRPTATFVIDPPGLLMDLAIYVHERILSLGEAKRRARQLEDTRQH